MRNILWLAPFPYEFAKIGKIGRSHPAPWIAELAAGVSKKTKLTIASMSKDVGKVDDFNANGIRFIFSPSPRLRYDLMTLYHKRIQTLLNYLQCIQSEFTAVHVHGTENQYEMIAHRLRKPYVISMQGIINCCLPFYPNKFSGVYAQWRLISFFEKRSIKMASNFICRTDFDRSFVKSLNPSSKIYMNWEPIRTSFYRGLYNPNSRYLLFLGGTNYFKGFREAVRCLDLLNKKGRGMRLRICGPGSINDIIRFIQRDKLGIQINDIDFLGYQSAEKLASIFSDSFCLLHPSYMDNSPNTVCEAQIAGLPVIASNVGGVHSLIDDGVSGLLVDRYNHQALATQVMSLLDDITFYRSISQSGRSFARERHDRYKILSKTLNIYSKIARTDKI